MSFDDDVDDCNLGIYLFLIILCCVSYFLIKMDRRGVDVKIITLQQLKPLTVINIDNNVKIRIIVIIMKDIMDRRVNR